MSYTKEDLVAVRRAIASGLLEVRYGDKTVRYPSIRELIDAEQHILAALSVQAGKKRVRIYRLRHKGKGV